MLLLSKDVAGEAVDLFLRSCDAPAAQRPRRGKSGQSNPSGRVRITATSIPMPCVGRMKFEAFPQEMNGCYRRHRRLMPDTEAGDPFDRCRMDLRASCGGNGQFRWRPRSYRRLQLFLTLRSDALVGRAFSDFAAIAFRVIEDRSQHVEAIRSFICGRSF